MEVRYYRDPETGLPPIYDHGVTEASVGRVSAPTRSRKSAWRYDSAVPDYRCAPVPGGTYFFTVNPYR